MKRQKGTWHMALAGYSALGQRRTPGDDEIKKEEEKYMMEGEKYF